MRKPIFFSAVLAALALGSLPAQAEKADNSETVSFVIDMTKSVGGIYNDVWTQAYEACRGAAENSLVAKRSNARAKCARQLTEDAINHLAVPQLTAFAATKLKTTSAR